MIHKFKLIVMCKYLTILYDMQFKVLKNFNKNNSSMRESKYQAQRLHLIELNFMISFLIYCCSNFRF